MLHVYEDLNELLFFVAYICLFMIHVHLTIIFLIKMYCFLFSHHVSQSLSLLCFLNLIKGKNCGCWRFTLVENCEVMLLLKDAMCSLCSLFFWRLKSVVGFSPVPFDAIHIVWCIEQELVKGYQLARIPATFLKQRREKAIHLFEISFYTY